MGQPKDISRSGALKKIEIAIDKMVDLQDAGYGNEAIVRILEQLNYLHNSINTN